MLLLLLLGVRLDEWTERLATATCSEQLGPGAESHDRYV
jgi:hypothetical protein